MSKPKHTMEFAMCSDEPIPCRVKSEWHEAGKHGLYFGKIYIHQWWGIVLWDDEEDPDVYKLDGLEVTQSHWVSA